MLDIDVNGMIWGIFMSATMKAAVHLGQNYEENLRISRVKAFFDISQSLILNQKSEIYGISTIEWNTIPWLRSTSLHYRAIKLSKAKEHACSDSVLCLGKIHEHPQSIRHWKIWMVRGFQGRSRIEWNRRRAGRARVKYFPRTHNTGSSPRDSEKDGTKWNLKPEEYKDRIILHVD